MEPRDLLLDSDYSLGRTCCVPRCGCPIHNDSVIPVCREHGMDIGRHFLAELTADERKRREAETRASWERHTAKRREQRTSGDQVVYYVRIGERIKIGYTKALKQRLSNLRVAPATDLLAIEPGGEPLERERHRQFAIERIHALREDFHPSERLLAHVASLREEHDLPRWARLPDTNAVTVRHLQSPP